MSNADNKMEGYYYGGGRYRKSSIALVPALALALLSEHILVVNEPRVISSKRINCTEGTFSRREIGIEPEIELIEGVIALPSALSRQSLRRGIIKDPHRAGVFPSRTF